MNKRTFRPSLSDILEDRLVLSAAAASVAPVTVTSHKPTSPSHPVLRTGALYDVINKIDQAFVQFNKEYRNEFVRLRNSGNQVRFRSDLAASGARLRRTLEMQAELLPGGSQALTTNLNARIDALLNELSTNTAQSSTSLIAAAQAGAQADVADDIQTEIANGRLSLR
jgi:hypothetical protein